MERELTKCFGKNTCGFFSKSSIFAVLLVKKLTVSIEIRILEAASILGASALAQAQEERNR